MSLCCEWLKRQAALLYVGAVLTEQSHADARVLGVSSGKPQLAACAVRDVRSGCVWPSLAALTSHPGPSARYDWSRALRIHNARPGCSSIDVSARGVRPVRDASQDLRDGYTYNWLDAAVADAEQVDSRVRY